MKKKRPHIDVYIDAEWGSDKKTICFQSHITSDSHPHQNFITFDSKYKELLELKGYRSGYLPDFDLNIDFQTFCDHQSVLNDHVLHYCAVHGISMEKNSVDIYLYLFYSPKDLWIGIGYNNFGGFAAKTSKKGKPKIDQTRNITGKFTFKFENDFKLNYIIKDVSGWSRLGLANLASSVGIVSEDKGLLDDYKSCMETGLELKTSEFVKYALNDVLLLKQVVYKQVESINWLIKEVLHQHFEFTIYSIPLTQGKLVSVIFTNFLLNLLPRTAIRGGITKQKLLVAAYCKLGVLNINHKNYQENLLFHNKLFDCAGYEEFLEKASVLDLGRLSREMYSMYSHFGFSHANIRYFLDYFNTSTGIFNCLVSGGRCNNEQPRRTVLSYCADIDLASCYGSALVDFSYPLGLPTVVAFGPNEKPLKLGEFLKMYGSKLVPNLYTITVTGKLSFEQDLLYSKLATPNIIKNSLFGSPSALAGSSVESALVPADFALLRRELKNAVLTSDILEFLKAVCTVKEYQEIENLDVVTAVFWSAQDRVDDLENWAKTVLSDKGSFNYDTDTLSLLFKTICKNYQPLPSPF